MTDAIYLIGPDQTLQRVTQARYSSEDVLQGLIESYPDILAGDQINPEDPPRWLLVSREAGVPDREDAPERWSADHLLIDQRGIPTFVEVKRSTDTRIRREVIGQMLEYAANATRYWPTDRIRALASELYGGLEHVDTKVAQLLGELGEPEETDRIEQFWADVEQNLRSGRVRLLFVADELPRELKRVIEFLNEHFALVEVLGVELRNYGNEAFRALVPRVIGQTERARSQKSTPKTRAPLTRSEFLDACPTWSRGFFERILNSAQQRGLSINWNPKTFNVQATCPDGRPVKLVYCSPSGSKNDNGPLIQIYLKDAGESEAAAQLRRTLLAVPGFWEAGEWTIWCAPTPATLEDAKAGIEHVLALSLDFQQGNAN